jgi:hypothetical protein
MPINMDPQLEPNWCWAAVTAAVKNFFSGGPTLQQCQVATPVLTREHPTDAFDCCANPDQCDIPAFLQDALAVSGNLSGPPLSGHLVFESVKDELDAGRPIGVRIQWPNGGGHFIVIDGYREFTEGAPLVHVADPQYRPCYHSYHDLVRRYQGVGVWTDTFLLKKG